MATPDWDKIAEVLFEDARRAIGTFADIHPGETCSRIEFFCDPGNGDVSLGFDTPEESLRKAKEYYQWSLSHVEKSLSANPDAVHSILKSLSLVPWNLGTVGIAYPLAVRWDFPEWRLSGDEDDLTSAVARCIWRMVERLIREDAFAELPMGHPCVVTYCNHDDDEVVVLRVLQWPVISL